MMRKVSPSVKWALMRLLAYGAPEMKRLVMGQDADGSGSELSLQVCIKEAERVIIDYC